MSSRSMISGRNFSVAAIALFGVLGLGAKGCDRAVVGDDGQCQNCTAGEGGEASGGSNAAGSAGSAQAGKNGSAGSATAGRGGSGSSGTGSAGTTVGGNGGGDDVCGGGNPDNVCDDDEYCDFPPDALCGAADATGVCRPIPEVCTADDQPVCGCDDQTYSNACLAAVAGVAVAKQGPCEPQGDLCAGLTGLQCAEDEYCSFPPDAMCGRADATGECLPKPQACDAIYAPVCGCDGKTYSSACEANMAGVTAESEGECSDTISCGGFRPEGTGECPDGMFCNYPISAQCGAADHPGVCAAIPDGCTDDYTPVCGCDDKTYSNACEAAAAGQSVIATGACDEPQGDVCGGIAALPCVEGWFCKYSLEASCGNADQTGICTPIPEICTANDDPVCGCNGVIYSNACLAEGAGQSLQPAAGCEKTEE